MEKKPILYLRTSTKDQNPELQKKDGIEFCIRMGIGEPDVYSEQGSAYKLEKVRPVWNDVVDIAKKEKRDIVVWRYDRAFRNREEFFKFMKVMFEVYQTKVYSVTEPSILNFWEMLDRSHSDNPIMNELMNSMFKAMWDFLIKMTGEEAEEESRKKSKRIKLAVRNKNGITKSYKGNKWGRKKLPKKRESEIMYLYRSGSSMRDIVSKVYYWDKNNKKKYVSIGYVHKTIDKFKGENNQYN